VAAERSTKSGFALNVHVRRRALLVAASNLAFAVLPVFYLGFFLITAWKSGLIGFDFRGTLWDPGKAILSGHSPYPAPHDAAIRTGNPAVYPPPLMLVVAPLTLLPWGAGLSVWLILSLAAVTAGLWLLEVRDWRIYGIALACIPLLVGLVHGNITLILLLGLAVAWHWRDRTLIVGASVAALVVAKLFLWPLFLWLLVTRRFRAAVYAAVLTVLAAIASWAIIDFDGLHAYPRLLEALDRVYSPRSISLTALGVKLGMSLKGAEVAALALALALLAFGVVLARHMDGDRRMYTAAVVGALVATPIMWLYYLTLLLVPLALYRPKLSHAWWIATGFWIVAAAGNVRFSKTPCCKPPGMPKTAWITLTTFPSLAVLAAAALFLAVTAAVTLRSDGVAARAPA